MENIKELVILIAEDDDGHAELIQKEFRKVSIDSSKN